MIEWVLAFSVRRRWYVLLFTIAAAMSGAWALTVLPIDAVPDITNVQVQVNAFAPALSPLEVEKQVTFPIEVALAGHSRPRKDLVVLAQRLCPGHRRLQRPDRYLFRAPAGDGAPGRRQERPAARCRREDGPDLDRSRRGLLVVGRIRRRPARTCATARPAGRATAPI